MGLERGVDREQNRTAGSICEFLVAIVNKNATEEEAQSDINELLALIVKSDPQQLGNFLINRLGRNNFTPHDDHKHWIIARIGEERMGPFAAISQVKAQSHPCPKLHAHPKELEEILIPFGDGLVSIIAEKQDSPYKRYQIPPLACYKVPRTSYHSVFNNNFTQPVTYLTVRRVIRL